VFDVKLQGQTVAAGLDIAAETGGSRRALVKSFADIPVESSLVIELESRGSQPPVLSAIRIERQ